LPTSRGCHQLIRQGAKLVETTTDVLEELQPALEVALQAPPADDDKENARQQAYDSNTLTILNLVDFAPTQLDEIAIGSNLPIEQVSSILLQLELAGEIAPFPGSQYQRIQK
jgi:DNA processing protein